MPNIEWNFLGHTISFNVLFPAVILPGILFTLLGVYPWLERWITRDYASHHLLDRPRNAPGRTAIGVMGLTFYLVLLVAGGNDVLAHTFDWSLQATTWVLRVLLLTLPPLAFYFTRRICLGLQHYDEELLHEGVESGIIVRLPSGAYVEPTKPLADERRPLLTSGGLGAEAGNGHHEPLPSAPEPRPAGNGVLASARGALGRFFTERTDQEQEQQ
jgi:ubiquinol-cytochrome c reductase cytochrome b subunit